MKELPIIEIDKESGFCFGVINAIKHAEKALEEQGRELYSLGDIVHNGEEVNRLEGKGMQTIDYEKFRNLEGKRVLFRAHGEPPQVYQWAKERKIELVDATCPVVVNLQKKIRKKYEEIKPLNGQIVIYGKKGHAEVNGLVGQTNGEAIIIQYDDDIAQIDFTRPVALFSQTTQSLTGYQDLIEKLRGMMAEGVEYHATDTICRQVSNRIPHIEEFAGLHEMIFFVAGAKSSNGKVLYSYAQKGNPRSVFVSGASDVRLEMLAPLPKSIGICGATSTPMWQMEEVADRIKELLTAQ
ncbi:MAG: 4-hydroxy-3-methylbut-2-enyl diphosphate reductase [Porphyromonas sp.]|nr:4-hydroxy-3-methylbut-2-enyl diphosphate reductase [Porphyromonas sp.]